MYYVDGAGAMRGETQANRIWHNTFLFSCQGAGTSLHISTSLDCKGRPLTRPIRSPHAGDLLVLVNGGGKGMGRVWVAGPKPLSPLVFVTTGVYEGPNAAPSRHP